MSCTLNEERLADRILKLHENIREVFVLEERAGGNVVVGEASRKGVAWLAE